MGNLWIVDSGTKRVYQFDAAASLTSGSLSPSTSFALAAGNTNPQGIADPPSGVAIPVASMTDPLPAEPFRGRLAVGDLTPTIPAVPLSAFDLALATLNPVAPTESVQELLVPDLLRARRRRPN